MELDIHSNNIVLTNSGSHDVLERLGPDGEELLFRMLKTGKMIKKPEKEGAIGIVRHASSKGKLTDIVFTHRKGAIYIISVNTGDVK